MFFSKISSIVTSVKLVLGQTDSTKNTLCKCTVFILLTMYHLKILAWENFFHSFIFNAWGLRAPQHCSIFQRRFVMHISHTDMYSFIASVCKTPFLFEVRLYIFKTIHIIHNALGSGYVLSYAVSLTGWQFCVLLYQITSALR